MIWFIRYIKETTSKNLYIDITIIVLNRYEYNR